MTKRKICLFLTAALAAGLGLAGGRAMADHNCESVQSDTANVYARRCVMDTDQEENETQTWERERPAYLYENGSAGEGGAYVTHDVSGGSQTERTSTEEGTSTFSRIGADVNTSQGAGEGYGSAGAGAGVFQTRNTAGPSKGTEVIGEAHAGQGDHSASAYVEYEQWGAGDACTEDVHAQARVDEQGNSQNSDLGDCDAEAPDLG